MSNNNALSRGMIYSSIILCCMILISVFGKKTIAQSYFYTADQTAGTGDEHVEINIENPDLNFRGIISRPAKHARNEIKAGSFSGMKNHINITATSPPIPEPNILAKYNVPMFLTCFTNINPIDNAPKKNGRKNTR